MVWYNRNLSGSNLVKLQEYWKERLGTDFERLQFPVDFLASDKRTFSGKRVLYDLDAEFVRTLEMLSRQNGCTPFMVCMTLTAILLYTYTGQRDFLIGTPMAGRNHKDLQDQIGMYVNVLPIRICLDPDDTFAGLLQKVRCWLVEATEYQFYPYLMMLEDLGLTSEDAHSPLLDVIVQSEDMPAETTTELTGLRTFACPSVVGSSKADLTFSFMIAGSLLTIEYKTDLYAPSTIDEIFSNIAGLMKTLGAGANQRLHAFPLLLSQEKEQEQEAFRQQMSGI
jgi:tyrocidine synthetase-3